MNLILLEPSELGPSAEVTLTGARGLHAARVLKVRPGQDIRIGLLDGPLGSGTVLRTDGDAVTLRCAFESRVPPRPRIDLLLALPRPKVMRRLWAPLAAMGVGQIILTNAGRVERDYFDTHILSESTYRPLLIEGLQQARDTRLPLVSIHTRFKVLVEDHLDALFGAGVRAVAHPGASARLDALAPTPASVCCWRSVQKAAGTTSSCGCSRRTDSSVSAWAPGRCAPTRPVSRCSASSITPFRIRMLAP